MKDKKAIEPSIESLINDSREDLEAASFLIEKEFYKRAVNSAYYSILKISRAALKIKSPSDEEKASKTHSGLRSAFSNCLVKSGEIDPVISKSLGRIERFRNLADYHGNPITKEEAIRVYDMAKEFNEHVGKYINNEINAKPEDEPRNPKSDSSFEP